LKTNKDEIASGEDCESRARRESFRKDTLNAWAATNGTGLHLTAEEADTWLARLELGEDTEPPECHV
jgi:predicted transcriptional regulator